MPDIDTDRLIWIVTGVSLVAELGDRPLAYRIEREIRERLAQRGISGSDAAPPDLAPAVISDVFYLNDEAIQARPTISVGGPGVNMLSGTLTEQLPTAVAVENVLVVQMDVEMKLVHATVWGMTHLDTVRAVELFISKYLDAYLDGVIRHQQSQTKKPQD
jgi:hypothetical protein